MKKVVAAVAMTALCLVAFSAIAKDEGKSVSAKLICGAHSANPEAMRAFQVDLPFSMFGPQLKAELHSDRNSGTKESFTGIVSPAGDILITGFGENEKGNKWIYQFSGKSNPNGDTELKGRIETTSGAVGGRDCSLIFMKPRAL